MLDGKVSCISARPIYPGYLMNGRGSWIEADFACSGRSLALSVAMLLS